MYKKINIRNEFHSKFSEFCKNQDISLKQATENLILYAMKHQIDLNQINDNATSSAKDLINIVGDKVQNLQNTYVSFQRTFESQNTFYQFVIILMTYQNMEFDTKDDTIFFKKEFFEQAILIRITTHPQQKLIKQAGGSRAFYDLQLSKNVEKEKIIVANMAIFEIIELAHNLVNDTILNLQKEKIKK